MDLYMNIENCFKCVLPALAPPPPISPPDPNLLPLSITQEEKSAGQRRKQKHLCEINVYLFDLCRAFFIHVPNKLVCVHRLPSPGYLMSIRDPLFCSWSWTVLREKNAVRLLFVVVLIPPENFVYISVLPCFGPASMWRPDPASFSWAGRCCGYTDDNTFCTLTNRRLILSHRCSPTRREINPDVVANVGKSRRLFAFWFSPLLLYATIRICNCFTRFSTRRARPRVVMKEAKRGTDEVKRYRCIAAVLRLIYDPQLKNPKLNALGCWAKMLKYR